MPTIGPFSIRFDQRKSDNSAYREKYVSGSNLIILTDSTGDVTGSKTVPLATITELTSSTTTIGDIFINGISKFFDKLYAYAGVVGDVTGSISGSNVTALTGSFTQLTASSIYGTIQSASFAENASLLDGKDSTTFATTGSNTFIGTETITGSLLAQTGSFQKLYLNNSSSAPTNATDGGLPGEIRVDNHFIYIYSGNSWSRVPKARWT